MAFRSLFLSSLRSSPVWSGRSGYSTASASPVKIPSSSGAPLILTYDVDETTSKQTGVAIIRLNRPEKLNALTTSLGRDLEEICDVLAKASPQQLRCVVVTGDSQHRAFSAGGDLAWLKERTEDLPHSNRDHMLRFYEYFLSLRKIGVPILAALNGHAIGAGACLAVSCDLRPAIAPLAKIGFNFTRIGLHPGLGATHFLSKAVGPHMTAQLLLSGELMTAKQAKASGIVSEIADSPDDVLPMTLKVARQIAENSPIAIRTLIKTVRTREEGALRQALLDEANAQSICYNESDMAEGLRTVRDRGSIPKYSWKA